jgi:DNA-binding XRE family transcriptional regulator/desulfoferrodoxin (superoxide reductase-like protein)
MDNQKVGALIKQLRLEKGMTQRALADALFISDRAVSKWERGAGCPDVSLLPELSKVFSVNIERLLSGEMDQGDEVKGNMKKLGFYVCPTCGNIMTATGEADISCCGRKLKRLEARKADEAHTLLVERVEDEYYISSAHEMTKEHALSFIAFVTGDRLQLIKLYPEWNAEARLYAREHGILYTYCDRDGLFRQLL